MPFLAPLSAMPSTNAKPHGNQASFTAFAACPAISEAWETRYCPAMLHSFLQGFPLHWEEVSKQGVFLLLRAFSPHAALQHYHYFACSQHRPSIGGQGNRGSADFYGVPWVPHNILTSPNTGVFPRVTSLMLSVPQQHSLLHGGGCTVSHAGAWALPKLVTDKQPISNYFSSLVPILLHQCPNLVFLTLLYR